MPALSLSPQLADAGFDAAPPGVRWPAAAARPSAQVRPQALALLLAQGSGAGLVWPADQLADSPAVAAAGGTAQARTVCATGFAALDAELPGQGWPLGQLVELLHTGAGGDGLVWSLLLPALRHLAGPRVPDEAGALGALGTSGTPASGAAQAHRRPRTGRTVSRPILLVGAPRAGAGALLQPYGPALAARGLPMPQWLWVPGGDAAARLWAIEQALRCPAVAAVVAWLPQDRRVGVPALRRLQLAAAQGRQGLFVLRPEAEAQASSPAPLRLHLAHAPGDPLQLQVKILKRRGPPLARPLCLPAQPDALVRLLAASRRPAPESSATDQGEVTAAPPSQPGCAPSPSPVSALHILQSA